VDRSINRAVGERLRRRHRQAIAARSPGDVDASR
jgi:hypothetical protein